MDSRTCRMGVGVSAQCTNIKSMESDAAGWGEKKAMRAEGMGLLLHDLQALHEDGGEFLVTR